MATVPSQPMSTLWSVLSSHAEAGPGRVATTFEGRETTYGALRDDALALAGQLAAAGVVEGARVGYLGKNSDRYFALLFAAAGIGAVLVPLNWRLAQEELAFIVEDSAMCCLISDGEFEVRARTLAERRAIPVTVLGAGLDPEDCARIEPGRTAVAACQNSSERVVFQVYTSGTTGRPKGAMLTSRSMLALREPGYRAGLAWFPQHESTVGVVLPVAHIAGTAYALFGFYAGARVAIVREFDAGEVLAMIARERVHHILLAPAAMQMMLEHPSIASTDLSSLRYITYGAAPIPEALLRTAIAALGCGFVQMYGMSEAAGGVVALQPDDHLSDVPGRLRSAGTPMPGVEVAIVDDQWERLPTGSTGEIAIRSPSLMSGYWGRPEATAEVFGPDGWMRTGDVGRVDADGYVFVLDRTKDMIISGGENVYPAEVENAIFGHPDVADVAVIGVPSDRWGEQVVAVIVPRSGKHPGLSEIEGWLEGKLARFKMPKQVFEVDSIPRNAGNKILRRVLREPFWKGRERQVN